MTRPSEQTVFEYGLLGAPCQTPIRSHRDLARSLSSSEDDIYRHGFSFRGQEILAPSELLDWAHRRGWQICQNWQGMYSWKEPTARGEFYDVEEGGRIALFDELLHRRALAERREIAASIRETTPSAPPRQRL